MRRDERPTATASQPPRGRTAVALWALLAGASTASWPATAPAAAAPAPAAGGTASAGAMAAGERAAVLARYAPAIVRVEAVLETRLNLGGQGEAEDSRIDLLGAVVDPGGLVMIWNSHVSSARMAEMLANAGRGEGVGIQVVPRSFTVTLAEGGEVPALLAATDSALDLAFLQLERPPEKPLPFVDFAAAREPAVGEEVVAVSRLGRGFDHAPTLQGARIGGVLRKPREAWILDGTLSTFGLPVFDRAGAPVGALTTVVTRGGEGQSFAGSPTVGQMIGGAMGFPGEGPLGVFVLPGKRVASLVELASERARKLLAERAAATPAPSER